MTHTPEIIVIEHEPKRHHSVQGTRLVHEYYGAIMAFAYSRAPLKRLVDEKFLGEWKYLHKSLFEIPEQAATRALIELGLYIRIIDDDEGKISSSLRKGDTYGEVERSDGSRGPLSYREVTNKIIHAVNYRWNFPDGQSPSVTCIAAKDEGARHDWVSATIDLGALGAICGAFMS